MVLRDRQAFAEDSLREIHSRGIVSLRRDIERNRNEQGEDSEGVTAEDVMETFERGGFTVTVTEGPFLEHLFRQASLMARWIAKFDWEVLVAPVPKTGFIVCDYPFTLVPPSANRDALIKQHSFCKSD